MTAPQASSRLEMLQARFQQKQLQEKEQKLLQLYDQQQQRAYQVVQRGSAGSNSSNHGSNTVRTTTTTHTTSTSQGGKVRQMFDERRQTTVKGIDRSYPLEPLENKLRKQTNTNGIAMQRNSNLTVNRQSVSIKRVGRADVNSNVNGGKPIVSYHEEVTRESFGPSVRHHDDEDEFGVENRVATFANGHYRHDADNEQEEALDQETIERNRMMAKIHLMGFDDSLKHRVRNDLESEEFPEYLMVDVPDKLPKRNVTKKLSQAEARLERFKNANAKRSNMPKQSTPISTVIKKRSEQMIPARSSTRITKSPSPDPAARKQHETNMRATRRSAPSSPSKSPDIAPTRPSTELRNQEVKPSRKSVTSKGTNSIGNKAATTGTINTTGDVLQNGSLHESITKKSNAFVIDFDDSSKEDDLVSSKKPPMKKSPSDKQQTASSASGRPTSSISSNSSISPSQGQVFTKGKMSSKKKTSTKPQAKGPFVAKNSGSVTSTNVKLETCSTCGRNFAQDRIDFHQEICAKHGNKKRKKFDAVMFRVKGTELEPFVRRSLAKQKQESNMNQKPDSRQVKSDWRRKHEEFINTIRYAKRQSLGLECNEPPPRLDTSDYIQCPHCSRKFNQAAAERHIPKCEHMLHNKPRVPKFKR